MPRLGARCKLIAIYPAPIVPQNFDSPLFLMSPVYYSGPCKNEYHTVKKRQSRTKLLEKVFPIMSIFLRNKTISKTTPLRKENPFPQFNVASHKRPGTRLSFEYTKTLLSGEGEKKEPVQLRCLEKCCPSIQFSQQFCPRL